MYKWNLKLELTLNQGSCIGSLLAFCLQPSFITLLTLCKLFVFLCSLPSTPLIHWFSGLSVLYEFSFPPFITWSLPGVPFFWFSEPVFYAPSTSYPFVIGSFLQFLALFLSFSPTKTAYKDQQPCHLNKDSKNPL